MLCITKQRITIGNTTFLQDPVFTTCCTEVKVMIHVFPITKKLNQYKKYH